MSKELNIKSSTIEKGLELAKDFLGKLISPTIEEVGLLISDNIKFLRFKNQVKILLKAKNYIEKNNISLKEIPIKILVPLLEKASLEDEEKLQDKWSNMLVNMVDSETNFQNQIFPHILSQMSLGEYEALQEVFQKEKELAIKYEELATMRVLNDDKYYFKPETKKLKAEIDKIEQDGFWLSIEEFEVANIARLGLIRQLPPKILIEEFQTGGRDSEYEEKWHQIDAEYDPDNYGYRITDLGRKFIAICELNEKAST
ncbi:Abi-alpha family protein [Daejeonella sp.]|uniref:Abi-alpha family protein n=1 Tax=Daejeonella sp. TaxID=2805397 RepID=UPI0025BF4322|nr:Abi-alpha family protein [Daejeonella sp.]